MKDEEAFSMILIAGNVNISPREVCNQKFSFNNFLLAFKCSLNESNFAASFQQLLRFASFFASATKMTTSEKKRFLWQLKVLRHFLSSFDFNVTRRRRRQATFFLVGEKNL